MAFHCKLPAAAAAVVSSPLFHKLHFSIVHLYLGSIAVFAVNYCGCDELPHLRLITAVAVIATKQPHKLEKPSLHLKAQSTPDKAISPSSWKSEPKFTALTNHIPSYSSKNLKKIPKKHNFFENSPAAST